MSKLKQAKKNIGLLKKLIIYLQNHPKIMNSLPRSASFVLFNENDENLNKKNMKILNSLLEEGNTVIKAEKKKDEKQPWTFTPVAA